MVEENYDYAKARRVDIWFGRESLPFANVSPTSSPGACTTRGLWGPCVHVFIWPCVFDNTRRRLRSKPFQAKRHDCGGRSGLHYHLNLASKSTTSN
jgi:hypothetical protein